MRVQCDYFDAHACRSCTWMGRPYADQLAATVAHARHLLADLPADRLPQEAWLPPVPSAEEGFRTRAKMVAGGTVEAPTLGILDDERHGVDLRRCGLHTPGVRAALPALAAFVTRAALPPYDVSRRRGELKHVLVTESPDAELMVRFVLRTTEAVPRIRKHLGWLAQRLPGLAVVSVNLQPEHKAVIEGPEEIVLTERDALPMRLAPADPGPGITLRLRPRSFFQTNTAVAAALYARARAWGDEVAPASVWDLYSGVGGFALHLANRGGASRGGLDRGRRVTGVEESGEAVAGAREAAAEAGLAGVAFEAADATAWTLARDPAAAPDLVVVNPPRRGIGPGLAGWLEASAAQHILYSSCHAGSLARDLAAMPSWRVARAQVFDMFPQTPHHEVLALLTR